MSDMVSNKSIPGPIEVTDEVRSYIPGDEIAIGLHRPIVIIIFTGPLCQCASIRLSYVCELHGNFRREHSHDKVRTHHPDLFTL